MTAKEARKILVFRVGHLGDTIVALPAFWAIRNKYPDSHIALLSNSSAGTGENAVPSVEVLPKEGLFDEFIDYGSSIGGTAKGLRMLGLAGKIRKGSFDSVFYLMTRNRPPSSIRRDVLFFRLCGIRDVIGAEYLGKKTLKFDETRPLPPVPNEAEFLLEILEDSGITSSHVEDGIENLLSLSDKDKASAVEWLSEQASANPAKSTLLGIGPGSKWDSKVWPEERFLETVKRLIEERDVFPVVFGGPEDREKAERLVSSWGKGAVAAGSLGVREAGAVLSLCDLYLGNDTGTMHLAAAAGVRCVAVFAAVDYPGRWAPFGKGHTVLRVQVPCEGCHSPDCNNEALCLASIGVEDVVSACLRSLDE